MAETRIQTVKDLASSRFDWEQALRDISRSIPANVTLTSLTGTISSGAASGSQVRGAITAPAVELKGCTTSQKDVATLLSRLRGVDGATRVSLSKSTKPAQTVGATTGTTTESTGCGDGRHAATARETGGDDSGIAVLDDGGGPHPSTARLGRVARGIARLQGRAAFYRHAAGNHRRPCSRPAAALNPGQATIPGARARCPGADLK